MQDPVKRSPRPARLPDPCFARAPGAVPVAALAILLAALGSGVVGCATAPGPVSKIVNGHVVVTRAISPEAYEHVTRALLYEEESRYDDAARELQRALPFDDGAAEVRAHLADLFLKLGRVEDAAEQVDRSLRIAPTVEGRMAAAHVAEARHDEAGALESYRAAATLALGDESPDAIERTHLALADAQLAALQIDAGYETVSTLRDASSDSVRTRVELGALAWALGKLPEAEAALDEALRLEPAEIDARLMLAALFGATGRIKEAKAAFHEALDRAEDPIEISEIFLKWLVARGDKAEAAEEADRLTPNVVDDGTVEMVIRIERAAGRLDQVKAAADQATKAGVPTVRLALLVSGALVDAKDYGAAAALLLTVPKGAPELVEARLRAAEALREGGGPVQLDRAAQALDEAAAEIASAPTAEGASAATADGAGALDAAGKPASSGPRDYTVDLAVARALLDEKRGDAVRAARTLDAALDKDPGNARLLLVRAAVEERRGEWRRALGFAEKVLSADARNVEALNFHGFVSADHDDNLAIATLRLQMAMVLDPGAGGIIDSLGWTYLHAGNLPRAAEALAEADRLQPSDPEILAHLGELYARQRDVPRAIETFRQALRHDPSDRLVREINTRLRALDARSAAGR
jgi:tetratricopeptide (TPR) repeat protein